MAINNDFTRTKLVTINNKPSTLTAGVVEDTTNKVFVVNVIDTVTKDDTTTVTKLLSRFKIKPVYVGNQLKFEVSYSNFTGDKPTATISSLTVPADSDGSTFTVLDSTNNIDLDAFYTAAGDVVNVTVASN